MSAETVDVPAEVPDVLVVSDDANERTTIAELLHARGFRVVGADDGATAWNLIRRERPRLVLLDTVLPDRPGVAIVRDLRSDPDIADIGVLMMTPMPASATDRDAGIDSEADGYIFRPVDHDELVARVRAQLRASELVERLRRSEERFRNLIRTQADAVLVVGLDGIIRYANPSAERMFDEPSGALEGRDFGAPIGSDEEDPTLELRDGRGNSITVAMSVATTDWDGGPAWIVSLRDMRRRLLLDEQVRLGQRLESIGRLTGGIAHDFNNLLSVILGASEEIMAMADGNTSELAEMITSAAHRGADLTQSLLAFASRQFLEPTVFDIVQLLTDMSPMLQRSLGDAIEVTVEESAGDERLVAVLDRAGFESALLNLCVNGRDALGPGGRLRIRIGPYTHSVPERRSGPVDERLVHLAAGNYVRVDVVDDGTGIAPADLAHVFEPFFTTKPPEEGTGLGLAMVYGFARQSGGLATVESELTVGTTVSLFLPRAEEGAYELPALSLIEPEEPASGSRRVLMVEDGDHLRGLIARQLVHLGHEVTAVGNPAEALDALDREHYDLLLSDIRLGGPIDGRELAMSARSRRPGMAILLMSGLALDARRHDADSVEVLSKPFGVNELAAALARALEER